MASDDDAANELTVLIKVLEILELRLRTREPRNNEAIQISQITNQFLPGTTIGSFLQSHRVEQGDEVGDKYEVHGSAQVGAFGKGAMAKGFSFGDTRNESARIDVEVLLKELKLLRLEMRQRASSTEDDLAVAAVGQAISSVEGEDTNGTLGHLKTAGKWAMTLATSIGAGVAAGAIKTALGL